MEPDPVERDREAQSVRVDVVGLRGGGSGGGRVLQPVHRLVDRRRDEPAAEEGDEREAGGGMAEAGRHGVERATQTYA